MADKHLVVVGASLAGLRAVEAARRAGHRGRITLLGAEPHAPYDRPPLSKAFLDEDDAPEVALRSEAFLRDELEVELVLDTAARALDTERRIIATDEALISFDALVIATGARARRLSAAAGLAGVHTLRTLDDARAVRTALAGGARTVVVGAGFIGSEVASAARKRGLAVTVVEAAPTPLVRAVGAQMGVALAEVHRRHGTDLRCGVSVTGLVGEDRVEGVQLGDGSVLSADIVVAGIGADPETAWLKGSGLALENGVVCDERLWTGVPGIYAAGDVARWHNPLFGRTMRIEHWTSAAEQAAVAAGNALGIGAAKSYSTVPYFWSDWYDSRIQFVGVPEADEVQVVYGGTDAHRFVALYRLGGRLVGALAVNAQNQIMKYRSQIAREGTWDAALAFAATRSQAA